MSLPSHVPEHPESEHHGASLHPTGGASLPRPLPVAVAERYRALFAAVREGDNARLEALSYASGPDGTAERLLLPDYLAERYLNTAFHPTEAELSSWLQHYASLPDAPFIQQKLEDLHRGGDAATEAVMPSGYDNVADLHRVEKTVPFSQTLTRNNRLDRALMDEASQGTVGAQRAVAQVKSTPGMTPAYAAQLHGEIAMQLLSQGETRAALRIGANGLDIGHYKVGFPAFVAGLAAWREGYTDAAYDLFENAANAGQTDGDIQAAASFWAGRVAERQGKTGLYHTWLHRASTQSESFYGLLAGRMLRDDHTPEAALSGVLSRIGLAGAAQMPVSEVDINVVSSMEEGPHFFALLQVGEQGRAEMLARQMWQDALIDPVRAHSLQLVVQKAGMLALAEQMQHALERLDHNELKEVLGPLPDLHPYNGFRLSSALVYAVARMESNFDASAASSAGAYGMMQVRPVTAGLVNEQYHLPQAVPVSAGGRFYQEMQRRLREPGYNLEVGQLYMLYLARNIAQNEPNNDASLVKVLAAYNAGPQAISRWQSGQKGLQDPLMFIECLPSPETRRYVRNVLTNDWVYGRRLHVATPSLVALAAGHWPSFQAEEQEHDSPS